MDSHDSEEPGFDLGAEPPKSGGYRVLARKYRPSTFDDLIGQNALVRTLSNAFDTGRIAQAYVFTGVRGVGKTTTARILARALNYEIPGKIERPTIHMPELGTHCRAIMEGRHVDVIEIDAASHTGIEDVRQITDGARYAPVSARYKVYIVDEVHMLSEKAWNAFLKTLEEPPPHVKFMFATTEIRKVPVTVLSRCQRFDLRRVDGEVITSHLDRLAKLEGISIEPEALGLIARASEGSVRDSLSILDQAIAHGAGRVEADAVRHMLGLADKGRLIDLFEALMRGQIGPALDQLKALHDDGADPSSILTSLAEFSHFITRIKITPAAGDDLTMTEQERQRGKHMAAGLSIRVLNRAWQMLMKGIGEVDVSPRPLASAEMVLVRIAYAADLPTPDEALKLLAAQEQQAPGGPSMPPAPAPRGGGGGPGASAMLASAVAAPQPIIAAPEASTAPKLTSLADIAALAGERRDILLKKDIETFIRLVSLAPGRLECSLMPGAPATLPNELGKKLSDWTGERWIISVTRDEGEATLREKSDAARAEHERGIRAHPDVQAVLNAFPGAEIVSVRAINGPEGLAPVAEDGDEAGEGSGLSDDGGWEPLAPWEDEF